MSVLSLEGVRVEPDGAALASAGVSRPAGRESVGAPTFVVRGWALGAAARALAVEMRAGDRLVRVAPVHDATPDVAEAYPDRPAATHCGFLTRVHVRGLEGASELRVDAVLADGGRAAVATIALGRSEAASRARRSPPAAPSIRPDVEQLVRAEAARRGIDQAGLLDAQQIPAVDGVDLAARTVLDLSGGPGHVARAARVRGAALVDSVHLDDELADLARLLDLYHRTTRVFVHGSLGELDRTYDVVLVVGRPPPVERERLDALAAEIVVRP